MTQPPLSTLVFLFGVLVAAYTEAQDEPSEQVKILEKKIDAAKQSNTYVHFKKGDNAHCLYDPVAKNAVALTVFHEPKREKVKLNIPGKELILENTKVQHFKIKEVDFYAIYRNKKIIIANTFSGQTGVIYLTPPRVK